jgi:hypothetical protein
VEEGAHHGSVNGHVEVVMLIVAAVVPEAALTVVVRLRFEEPGQPVR